MQELLTRITLHEHFQMTCPSLVKLGLMLQSPFLVKAFLLAFVFSSDSNKPICTFPSNGWNQGDFPARVGKPIAASIVWPISNHLYFCQCLY